LVRALLVAIVLPPSQGVMPVRRCSRWLGGVERSPSASPHTPPPALPRRPLRGDSGPDGSSRSVRCRTHPPSDRAPHTAAARSAHAELRPRTLRTAPACTPACMQSACSCPACVPPRVWPRSRSARSDHYWQLHDSVRAPGSSHHPAPPRSRLPELRLQPPL